MEIGRLKYFARIAQDGSLTRAAGVLRVAQPALSRQLRLLEEELGVALFTRTARGMRLTEEGAYLRDAVAGPIRALDIALQEVRSLGAGAHGSLVVGMTTAMGDVLASRFVAHLATHYPDIRLRVIEGATGSLFEWLQRGIVDYALVEDAANDDRFVEIELLRAPLLAIGGAHGDLDPARPIAFGDLLRRPLILPSHHLGIRATINQAAVRARATLAPVIEADSVRLIVDLVAAGRGYAVLPAIQLAGGVADRLRHAPIVAPELAFRVFLTARHRDGPTNRKLADAVVTTLHMLLEGERIAAAAGRDAGAG